MSAHSSRSSESDLKSIKTLLKQLSKDFQSLSYRYLEHEEQIKELKMAKGKDENSSKSKKSSHASSSKHHESFEEESLKINEYYQPQPRRTRRERQEKESPREVRVDLPHFHGKENVEIYLDWKIKVEQLFACHKVSEENKVPLATLSLQGNAMYWWTPSREIGVFIKTLP